MTEIIGQVWEYAVMRVEWAYHGGDRMEFTAEAWLDEQEIYRRVLSNMYWSAPLADMGRMGWELVGTNAENVRSPSDIQGFPGNIEVPVVMVFFFKRVKH